MAMAEGNDVPSSRRMPVPDSKSAPISRGIFARRCSSFVMTAVGYTWLRSMPSGPRDGADDQAADVIVLDLVEQFFIFGAFGGGEHAEVIDHQHLADLFAQRSFS